MTAKDIILDLEDCITFKRQPNKELLENAVELIKHQLAENERLKAEVKFSDYLEYETTNQIKAEAYKECIEKVKEYIDTHEHLSCEECECVPVSKDGLDNLLKEKVGDT